jgi:UDP-N-acetylglucosamine acyltransferase
MMAIANVSTERTVIHPTAIIHDDTRIGEGVTIGPYAIVGERCVIGDGCTLAPRAVLEKNVTLAAGVKIGIGSILGGDPQDLKFGGEVTFVEIGENTTIREYSTINRGTAQSGKTTVGANCLIMSYVHLAHDCHVGNGVILANGTQFAGHVTVEDKAAVSGLCTVHQFARIGRYAYIGGSSRVPQDVPPFVLAVGNPMRLSGLNSVGLRRAKFADDTLLELKRAYRILFRSDLNLSQALEKAEGELRQVPEVVELLSFMRTSSQRGITS